MFANYKQLNNTNDITRKYINDLLILANTYFVNLRLIKKNKKKTNFL